jgi:hypothetical protein
VEVDLELKIVVVSAEGNPKAQPIYLHPAVVSLKWPMVDAGSSMKNFRDILPTC